MKSILIITPYDHIAGGVETVTEALIHVLTQDGYRVQKLTSEKLVCENIYERIMTKVFGLPYLTSKAFKRMNGDQFSHVICNGEFSWGISHPGLVVYFHGSYLGLRDFSSRRSWKSYVMLSWRAFLQKCAARGATVVSVSEFLSAILKKQGIFVSHVISNPVDLVKFHPINAKKDKDYFFIGRFDYFSKGIDILEKLAKRAFEVSIYSFGSVNNSFLNVKPSPSSNEINNIYNQYKILIFPSRFESFGMVPAEAMAAGLPILMHPVGLGAELKKEIPLYVIDDFLDEKVLNEKIKEIKDNYDYYSNLSRKYAIDHFSLDQFKKKWINILNA